MEDLQSGRKTIQFFQSRWMEAVDIIEFFGTIREELHGMNMKTALNDGRNEAVVL